MYNKKHIILTAVCTAIAVWVLACVFFVGFEAHHSSEPLLRAKKIIQDNYVYSLTEKQVATMEDYAIAAMVHSLKDSYSAYLDAETLAMYEDVNEEEYQGIGIEYLRDEETGIMTVEKVMPGSPAFEAGIKAQDKIIRVGTIPVNNETYEKVYEYMKDEANNPVELTILRGEEEIFLTVSKSLIRRQTVEHSVVDGHIGYIRISEFIHYTKDDFKEALSALEQKEIKGLIIDLRNNPGGYAEAVIDIADRLLPEGVIAYLEDSRGNRHYERSDKNSLDLPMVVLVNGESASASELLAGSLQAHEKAVIVGEQSYGKAIGQSMYPVTTETAIYLTNSRYFTPKGDCIQGTGITPDVEVILEESLAEQLPELSLEQDLQLAKGIEILQEKLS